MVMKWLRGVIRREIAAERAERKAIIDARCAVVERDIEKRRAAALRQLGVDLGLGKPPTDGPTPDAPSPIPA